MPIIKLLTAGQSSAIENTGNQGQQPKALYMDDWELIRNTCICQHHFITHTSFGGRETSNPGQAYSPECVSSVTGRNND
jgi:hypothetical protein